MICWIMILIMVLRNNSDEHDEGEDKTSKRDGTNDKPIKRKRNASKTSDSGQPNLRTTVAPDNDKKTTLSTEGAKNDATDDKSQDDDNAEKCKETKEMPGPLTAESYQPSCVAQNEKAEMTKERPDTDYGHSTVESEAFLENLNLSSLGSRTPSTDSNRSTSSGCSSWNPEDATAPSATDDGLLTSTTTNASHNGNIDVPSSNTQKKTDHSIAFILRQGKIQHTEASGKGKASWSSQSGYGTKTLTKENRLYGNQKREEESSLDCPSAKNVRCYRNKNKRTKYSKADLEKLNRYFSDDPYLSPEKQEKLAEEMGYPDIKIKTWFQNKRARNLKPEQKLHASSTHSLSLAGQQPAHQHSLPANNVGLFSPAASRSVSSPGPSYVQPLAFEHNHHPLVSYPPLSMKQSSPDFFSCLPPHGYAQSSQLHHTFQPVCPYTPINPAFTYGLQGAPPPCVGNFQQPNHRQSPCTSNTAARQNPVIPQIMSLFSRGAIPIDLHSSFTQTPARSPYPSTMASSSSSHTVGSTTILTPLSSLSANPSNVKYPGAKADSDEDIVVD